MVENYAVKCVQDVLFQKHIDTWKEEVNSAFSKLGNVVNELRTYNKFKQAFHCELYVTYIMSIKRRSAQTQFRPIRLETGRYEGLAVRDSYRLCPFCIGAGKHDIQGFTTFSM